MKIDRLVQIYIRYTDARTHARRHARRHTRTHARTHARTYAHRHTQTDTQTHTIITNHQTKRLITQQMLQAIIDDVYLQ